MVNDMDDANVAALNATSIAAKQILIVFMLIIPGSLNDAHYIDARFYVEYTDYDWIQPE